MPLRARAARPLRALRSATAPTRRRTSPWTRDALPRIGCRAHSERGGKNSGRGTAGGAGARGSGRESRLEAGTAPQRRRDGPHRTSHLGPYPYLRSIRLAEPTVEVTISTVGRGTQSRDGGRGRGESAGDPAVARSQEERRASPSAN